MLFWKSTIVGDKGVAFRYAILRVLLACQLILFLRLHQTMGNLLKINKYPGLCGMLTKESTLLGHSDEISQHLRNGLLHVFFLYIKQVKLAKMWDDVSDFSEYLEKTLLA